MKNRGFTIVEALVVAFIATSFLGIIFGVLMVGRNTWVKNAAYIDLQEKARYSLDKIARELSQSSIADGDITVGDCSSPPTGYTCIGNYVKFMVPISNTSDISGSIYKPEGTVKWGAKDREGWHVTYLVSNTAPNQNRLMRIVPTDQTGACCKSGNCSVRTQASCSTLGGQYYGNGVSCSAVTCPTTCFLGGTPILMSDGSTKPIEEVKVGDKILAFDEETKELKEDSVKLFFEHDAQEYLVVNGSIKATVNHPVYSDGKWMELGQLKIGDNLLSGEGRPVKITDIKLVKEPVKVYNLEVNPYHTYIAGGIVAHNKRLYIPVPPPGGEEYGCPPYCMRDRFRDFFKKLINGSLLFADELFILASNIKTMAISIPSGTHTVKISITTEGKTMLGETVSVTLDTTVYLRN